MRKRIRRLIRRFARYMEGSGSFMQSDPPWDDPKAEAQERREAEQP
jgi:hypothetical protein